MTIVRVSWVAESRGGIPPTTPPLDTWRAQILDSASAVVAELTIPDLTVRSLDLNVPNAGVGFVAKVAIISADATVIGPEVASTPFDVTEQLVPVSVTVTFPT